MTAGTPAPPGGGQAALPPVDYWITNLGLTEIPLGGYFARTFAADFVILHAALPERFVGDRQGYSADYYLLQQGSVLGLHQLNQDELWNLYVGGPIRIHVFGTSYSTITIGWDVAGGQALQAVAPHNTWFGGELVGSTPYALAGCSLSPGFDPRDSSLPTPSQVDGLIADFPAQRDVIERLAGQTPGS